MTREMELYQAKLKAALSNSPTPAQREKLYRLHTQKISDYQHERMVNLLVALFFGLLTIGSYVLLLFTFGKSAILAGILSMLLTLLEGGYVLRYSRIETSIQELYSYTDKLAR